MGLRPEIFGISLKDFLASRSFVKGTEEYEQFMAQLNQHIDSAKRSIQGERSSQASPPSDSMWSWGGEVKEASEDLKRMMQEHLESRTKVFDDIRDTIVNEWFDENKDKKTKKEEKEEAEEQEQEDKEEKGDDEEVGEGGGHDKIENENHIQAVIRLFVLYGEKNREKFGTEIVSVASNFWNRGGLFDEVAEYFGDLLSEGALTSLNQIYRGRCLFREGGQQDIEWSHYSFLSNEELTVLNKELKSLYDEYKQRKDSEPKKKKQKRVKVLPESVEQFIQECLVWFSDILKKDLDFFMYTM